MCINSFMGYDIILCNCTLMLFFVETLYIINISISILIDYYLKMCIIIVVVLNIICFFV